MSKSELDELKREVAYQYSIDYTRSSDICLMCSKNEEIRLPWRLGNRVCEFVTDYFNTKQKVELIIRDMCCLNTHECESLKKNGKIEKMINIYGIDFPVCIHSEDDVVENLSDKTYLIDTKLPIDRRTLIDIVLSMLSCDNENDVFSNIEMTSLASQNLNSKNQYEKSIAEIIVFLNPIKQDELAEKLYVDIDRNLTQGKIKTEFYEYDSYLDLVKLYNSFSFLKQCDKNDIEFIKSINTYSSFDLNCDVLLKNMEKGIIKMERKYGKKLLEIQECSFEKYGISVRAAVWIHNLTV